MRALLGILALAMFLMAGSLIVFPQPRPEQTTLPVPAMRPVKSGEWVGVGKVTLWLRDDGTCWWESANGLWERERSWCE